MIEPQPVIQAQELSKSFEISSVHGPTRVQALQQIECSILAGECIGLLGPNGSGKSTFLRLIAGLSKPSAGRLLVMGTVGSLHHIASALNPELTGRQNAQWVLDMFSKNRPDANFNVEELMSRMGLGPFFDMPTKHYSNGMHLRLSFALLSLLEFDIYLFDEVFHVGDHAFQDTVRQFFHQLRKQNKTILIASHQLRELQLCDRIFTFSDGKIEFAGMRSEGIKRYAERSISQNTPIETQSPVHKPINQSIKGITLHAVSISQSQPGPVHSEEPLHIQLDFSNEMPTRHDPVLLIFDHLGQSIALASPIFNPEPLQLDTQRNQLSVAIPGQLLGSDLYTLSVAFFPDLENKLLDFGKHNSINWAEESIYFDTLAVIKPQFRIGGKPVDLSQTNLVGSFIISQAWKKD